MPAKTKRKPGRPRKKNRKKKRGATEHVYLQDDLRELARRIGQGNILRGIRKALKTCLQWIPPAELEPYRTPNAQDLADSQAEKFTTATGPDSPGFPSIVAVCDLCDRSFTYPGEESMRMPILVVEGWTSDCICGACPECSREIKAKPEPQGFCERCEGRAETTVATRSFGNEYLCHECADAVRKDGQEVPAPQTSGE